MHQKIPTKTKRNYREMWSWTRAVCIPVLLVLFLNTFIIKFAIVDGNSMYPSLYNNNILIFWQARYDPTPDDIILISSKSLPANENNIVKRVIAIEGQTVLIDYKSNIVYVDGSIISEPYLNYEQADPLQSPNGVDIETYEVPEGYLFVMGDNRNFSVDSRDIRVGMVRYEDVRGGMILNIPLGRVLQ